MALNSESPTETEARAELLALGQYHAARTVMLGVISLVGLTLALSIIGFIVFLISLQKDPADVTWLIALLFVSGAVWFVVFLAKSLQAYSDHEVVDQAIGNRRSTHRRRTTRLRVSKRPEPGIAGGVASPTVDSRLRMASNPQSRGVLPSLVSDSDPAVRKAVALNPSTPEALLRQLAEDANFDVAGLAGQRLADME